MRDRLRTKCVGYIIMEELAASLVEQGQPAIEQPRLYSFHSEMDRDGVTLVAPASEHHRGPEVVHRREVGSPVAGNSALENRSELGIGADLGVEAVNQVPDRILR